MKRMNDSGNKTELLIEKITALEKKLSQAQIKYREITGRYDALKDQLDLKDEEIALLREKNRANQRLAKSLKDFEYNKASVITKKEDELNRIKTILFLKEEEIVKLKEKNISIRNHLSYSIGWTLVNSVKSLSNFIKLPKNLFLLLYNWKTRKATVSSKKKIYKAKKRKKLSYKNRPEISSLKELKIAAIMDEFTYSSYKHEASILNISPHDWETQLEVFNPNFLFVESAWRGCNDLWDKKVSHVSQEISEIVTWFNKRNLPTIFWNKEDPVHFNTFLNTAKLFDYVFTTDVDCIPKYKKFLLHNRVYFLPFAFQPKSHNPIEIYERKQKFCFAGAYYQKYPERTIDLNDFVENLPKYKDLEIYDRNYKKDDGQYKFPESFSKFIVGGLKFSEIDKAYKGYEIGINLNSIKQSQSMFARRVFELIGSNTLVVSNYSKGLRLMFGELVQSSDSGKNIIRNLIRLGKIDKDFRIIKLKALRKVLTEHTYENRLNFIYSKFNKNKKFNILPIVYIFGYVRNSKELDLLLSNFNRQTYQRKKLYIICNTNKLLNEHNKKINIEYLSINDSKQFQINNLFTDSWISFFASEDFYGDNFINDLVLASKYSDADIIGKKQFLKFDNGDFSIPYKKAEYIYTSGLNFRNSIVNKSVLSKYNFSDLISRAYTIKFDCKELSIDGFNYCMNGSNSENENKSEHYFNSIYANEGQKIYRDEIILNNGISLQDFSNSKSAKLELGNENYNTEAISPENLYDLFSSQKNIQSKFELNNTVLNISSDLKDGAHEYVYASKLFNKKSLNVKAGKLNLHLETSVGLNIQLVIVYLDKEKQKISHDIIQSNKNYSLSLPDTCRFIKIGLRIYSNGNAYIENLYLSNVKEEYIPKIKQSECLVITNNYPEYKNLYKNAFLHTRLKEYKKIGLSFDVFRCTKNNLKYDYEFDDIEVTSGDNSLLEYHLMHGAYKKIIIHFLNDEIWDVVKRYIKSSKIFIWCHGAEIQSFERRAFAFTNPEQRKIYKNASTKRDALWIDIINNYIKFCHFIFVSKYLYNCVIEDLNVRIPSSNYSIIPNPIDTKLFSYSEKSKTLRKKILLIRPFTSSLYANDIAVNVILKLKNEPFFKDLEFCLIGDGVLFDETTYPVKHFENVKVIKGFLDQGDISKYHQEYGLFLCPSRMDTQGVSRDEARSSGLVPLASNVAAVPEFLSNRHGYLADFDSCNEICSGIKEIYNDGNLFKKLSRKNASYIRQNLSISKICQKELSLINNEER